MTFILLAFVMVLLALLLIIVPLLRQTAVPDDSAGALALLADDVRALEAERAAGELTEEACAQERQRLERQALELQQRQENAAHTNLRANWGAALTVAIVLPFAAALTYFSVGQPSGLYGGLPQADAVAVAPGDDAIAVLSQRLAENDADAEGWILLARSYFQLQRMDEALDAYRKATTLMADNPDLWVEYANTLAISHDRDLSGEPEQLVAHALELDPDNFNALAFAGLAALQRDDNVLALRHWQHLAELLPAGSEDRARIDSLIARAEGKGAPSETALAPPSTSTADAAVAASQPVAAAGEAIRGTVTLSGALAAKVAPSDSLFIFAKAANGPAMPLAAVRTRATGWPVAFTLDDSSAMVAGMALSNFASVNIVARVSRLGNASAQPGDIEGTLENVMVGSDGVQLVLDRVVER